MDKGEYNPNARVLIITDREELDGQIEGIFIGVEEQIYRARSGKDLLQKLNDTSPWLIGSLVHKFGGKEEVSAEDVDNYLKEIKSKPALPADCKQGRYLYICR